MNIKTLLTVALTVAPVLSGYCGTNCVINLSHYDQIRPQFTMMAKQGMVGAIHEATYPCLQVDSAYAQRQAEALQAGLCWGAYHFGDATNPVKQADHFMDVVENRWRQAGSFARSGVLLVLDFEKNNHYPGGTMKPEQAAAFARRVKQRAGCYPGLYASECRIKEVLNSPLIDSSSKETLTNCWLWVANYHHTPAATAPWPRWDLWQYTGDGICDLPRKLFPIGAGNMHAAERNIFRGSASAMRSFWESHSWQPVKIEGAGTVAEATAAKPGQD